MHDTLFDTFSNKVVVTDKYGVESNADAVIAFGTDELDEYNEVVGRVDKASFRSSSGKFVHGDIMQIPTGEWAGHYILGRTVESNGYVTGYEITRSRNA